MALSREERNILKDPVAKRWLIEAEEHWEKYLPSQTKQLKEQGKFKEEIQKRVIKALKQKEMIEERLNQSRDIVEEKDPHKKQGMMNMNALIAEEEAARMYLFPEPEISEEEEEVSWAVKEMYQRYLEMVSIQREIAEVIAKINKMK